MVTKRWLVSVMYLSHVSNNGHQGGVLFMLRNYFVSNNGHQGVASFRYVSHVSNNGHQGVVNFRLVPISCE